MDPSIASIPRFTQNPRALPSAFAVLCAKPLGVQWLNCIPLSDFFRHTSIFYKKSQVLCLLPPGFAAIRINFIAASKKNAPSRGESLWAVRSSFLLFKFFYLTKQSSRPNGQNGGALGNTAARSTVPIQSADGTIYVQGTSDVTVTVSSYTTQIDTTGASTVDSWNSYAAA